MTGPSFTDRELDIMAALWDLGPATVPEVRERLPDELAYTTVQTILRTLESKGFVTHHEDGRFHRYRATVQREEAEQSALNRLVAKLFRGSPELLLSQLVSQRKLSEEQLRRMRRLLDDYEEGGGQ
jgi:BlaI family transcriptional regulator, penicillinase repressor